jgi:hypothetical protein
MAKTLKTGSAELRDAINTDNSTEVVPGTGAITTALSLTKGVSLLAPTGNVTGTTLAAPTTAMIGQTKLIANTAAFSWALTISGMVRATQNVFTFVAAADTVIGPSLLLKVVNTSTTSTPSAAWVVVAGAGFVAGTSAVA